MAKRVENNGAFLLRLLAWSKQHSHFALLNSNQYPDSYSQYDLIFGAGAKRIITAEKNTFDVLANEHKNAWLFGYICYDAKNDVEKLYSKNYDGVKASQFYFFEPEIVGFLKDETLQILGDEDFENKIFAEIFATKVNQPALLPNVDFVARMDRSILKYSSPICLANF